MNNSIQLYGRFVRQTFQNGIKHRNFTRTPTTRSMDKIADRHAPTPREKKMLVWTKMFKSEDEIPRQVSYTTMRKARDLMRIRVNLGMAAATVLGCIIVISYSKSRVGDGDSLQKRGLDWQAEMRERGIQERARQEKGPDI